MKKQADIFGIIPEIGDLIAFNPPKYKGLIFGQCVRFSEAGLPELKIDLEYDYVGQINKSGFITPKTGFVVHQKNMLFNQLKEKVTEFSERKFGYDSKKRLLPVAYKFMEECKELFDAIDQNLSESEVNGEFADCLLLIVDLYRLYNGNNIDMQKLIDTASYKLDICENRKWGEPDENGVIKHIKE